MSGLPGEVYGLNGKYYQKLGEVWDHETKDFKVLYKPLYECDDKVGSFEGHYLAVSTFERWNSKFVKLSHDELFALPPEVLPFLVRADAVTELGSGCTAYPLTTSPLPAPIRGNRAIVAAVAPDTNKATSTVSGFGSRSHKPYITLHFHEDFKGKILSGGKRATTRLVRSDRENPDGASIGSIMSLASAEPDAKRKVKIKATSTNATDGLHVFAELELVQIDILKVNQLTSALAQLEGFESLSEFKNCLLRFYPLLAEDDEIHVIHFQLSVSDEEAGGS